MDITTSVQKEAYELGSGLGAIVVQIMKQLKDGFQAEDDLGPILTSLVKDLIPAVDGIQKIPQEFVDDAYDTIDGVNQGLKPHIKVLIKGDSGTVPA